MNHKVKKEIKKEEVIIKKNPNIKILNDISYNLFDFIFNDIQITNFENKDVIINGYEDFYNYQKDLNSHYKTSINSLDYKKKINDINIIKEIPYKQTKLRKINSNDSEIIIAPNQIFAKTLILENKNQSSLAHYINIIGNSLIIEKIHYFEVKILNLGEDTDLYIGIISKDSLIFTKDEYKNFPIPQFKGGYAINLNNHYEFENNKTKYLIKEGDIITVLININKNNIHFFINGKKIKNNKIFIENNLNGYYPAFSLSSEKEIQVNFGGDYKLKYNCNEGSKIDIKPICKFNNLESIILLYMKIINSKLININNIINHPQITNNESLRFFYPMLNFFGNYAFRDEYIIKKYILKNFYKDYNNNNENDIYKFFDSKIKFIKLIIQTIDLPEQKNSILFLLNRLAEQIKHYSYNKGKFEIWSNLIKLYNYFLKNEFIQNILFKKNSNNSDVNDEIKKQLYIIFQPIKIFNINFEYNKSKDLSIEDIINKEINVTLKNKYNKIINNKSLIQPYVELINTLLSPKLKNQEDNLEDIHELINKEYMKKQNNINKIYNSNKLSDLNILVNYLSLDKVKMNNDIINNKRSIQQNNYRIIFFDLIKDIYYSKSNSDKYNLITTILFPLLSIFNKTYEEENLLNITKSQILTFLPIIGEYDNLSFLSSNIILSKDNINNIYLNSIIKLDKCNYELYNKKYVISSYILKIIINLFAFLDGKCNDFFNLEHIIKSIKYGFIKNKENIDLNKYIYKLKNLLLLFNDENIKIIGQTINILVPYLNELIENNYYSFLPSNIINGIKFFVLFILKDNYINEKLNLISKINIVDLIDIYIHLNILLMLKTADDKLKIEGINNIKLLFILIEKIENFNFINVINETYDKNINNQRLNLIKRFFHGETFQSIFDIIIYNYNESNNNILKKNIENFIIYLSSKYNTQFSEYFSSSFLTYISQEKMFLIFQQLIMDACVKRKLIKKIVKISKIINNIKENENINENDLDKLRKYFQKALMCLSCTLNYISKDKVIDTFFSKFIQISELNPDEDLKLNIDPDENEKYPVYYYLFVSISLIIKKLITEKLFMLFKKNVDEYFIESLYKFIRKSIIFLKKVIIDISNFYIEKKYLISKEDNNKINKNNLRMEEYLKNIINNIKKTDIANIICLMEKNNNNIPYQFDKILFILKEIITFLNEIENQFNIKMIDSQDQKESKRCPICFDNYSDCHVTPCGHMFCFDCIKKFKDLRCPFCRKEMTGVLEYPNFKFPKNNQQNVVISSQNNIDDTRQRFLIISWINRHHHYFIEANPHIINLDYNDLVELAYSLP